MVETEKLVNADRLKALVRAFHEAGERGLTRKQICAALGTLGTRAEHRARMALQDAGADRVFYQGMSRYGAFFEAMEANNVTPEIAVKEFYGLLPKKAGKLRIEREAEGVAKILA